MKNEDEVLRKICKILLSMTNYDQQAKESNIESFNSVGRAPA